MKKDKESRSRALDEWAKGIDDPLGRVLDKADRVYLIDKEEAEGLETLDVMALGESLLEAERVGEDEPQDWARGRKPRRSQAANSTLGIRLTQAERDLVEAAAQPGSKAEFIRGVLLRHIEEMVRSPQASEQLLGAYQRYLDE